jgi:flagellar biosynthesis/type III secretory pathway protein FliH
VVETERGSWDAQVETQLERIEETLRMTLAEWIDEEAA